MEQILFICQKIKAYLISHVMTKKKTKARDSLFKSCGPTNELQYCIYPLVCLYSPVILSQNGGQPWTNCYRSKLSWFSDKSLP